MQQLYNFSSLELILHLQLHIHCRVLMTSQVFIIMNQILS